MFKIIVKTNMKKLPLLLLFPILFNAAMAQVKQSVVKSSVIFHIKNLGFNVDGNLGGLQADILFDPANVASSKIDASVETKTINTDNEGRDKHLKKDDYFDVEKYPKIRIKSVSLKHKGGENFMGMFDVTIKDKTKQIEIPFKYTEAGKAATFTAKFKLNRVDFGVGGKSMILSDELTVDIQLETSKE
jgi:polyisoprenoid-binding protein YceI